MLDNVDSVWWWKSGTYKYETDGKETLIEDGQVLIHNADWGYWDGPSVYRYNKDGKTFEVKDGVTTELK